MSELLTFEGETFRESDWHMCSTVRLWLWRKVGAFCEKDRNYAASGREVVGGRVAIRSTAMLMPDCWPVFFYAEDPVGHYTGHDLPVTVALKLWELEWETPNPISAIDQLVRVREPLHLTVFANDPAVVRLGRLAWS